MRQYTRREFLGATGLAAAAGVAGCVGGSGSDGRSDTLRLKSLDVAGSPGGTVAVQPPGEAALVDFFATWCAPCKPQMKHLRTVREEFPDLHMVSVTWESDEGAIRKFWREYDGTWPVAMDPETKTGARYDVKSLPTKIVFAPDGAEVWRHVGLAAADTIVPHVEAALDE